ncbi:35850_t:CDS:2 [Racocetra persica]|uniref:35850_t:CDS:1 n=1 Tax=Racocetra persica TaxID=160502 RepID=A0ACA9M1D6_9GLOM|nr:35850_t:CDS:2 [Racocetra persica]
MAPKRTKCTDRAQDQTSNSKKQEAHQQEYVIYVSTTSSNKKRLTGELTTMMLPNVRRHWIQQQVSNTRKNSDSKTDEGDVNKKL